MDLTRGQASAIYSIQSWNRYRAFIHKVPTSIGDVLWPLDRIHPDYEYLEEVRFELFTTVSRNRQGLLNYLEEVASHLYNAVPVYGNDNSTRAIIRNETGLPIFRIQEDLSQKDFYKDRWQYWATYFPSYTVSGIAVKGVPAVLYSPYEDEVHSVEGYVFERANTTSNGRPKIKITRRFDD